MVNTNKDDSFLTPEQQNSGFLKKELMSHMYYRLGYAIVVDEFRFMDVFGIRRNGYGVEFEIKISKSDFDRELKCINSKQESVQEYGNDWEKFSKHRLYLDGTVPKTQYNLRMEKIYADANMSRNIDMKPFRPNEFYFYVPDYLSEYAESQLTFLPYGLVKIGKTASGNPDHFYYWRYTIIKKAQKLHNDKVDNSTIESIAHALSIRNRIFHESNIHS